MYQEVSNMLVTMRCGRKCAEVEGRVCKCTGKGRAWSQVVACGRGCTEVYNNGNTKTTNIRNINTHMTDNIKVETRGKMISHAPSHFRHVKLKICELVCN